MEKQGEGVMRRRIVSYFSLVLLAGLQITTPTSGQDSNSTASYLTRPADVMVAVGEPAVFRCGVAQASPNLTLTLYGSHSNYSLSCPDGHVEDIPQALYGSCDMQDGESLAVWTLRGTSFSDNGTRVVCQQLDNPDAPVALLHVYDNGTSNAILIGCVIGGFFGFLLVAALSYAALQRSKTLQKFFCGYDTEEEDLDTIVTKD